MTELTGNGSGGGGQKSSWISWRRRISALLLEALRATPVGVEVEGDSEPDMGEEADMGSTIEIGGTKRGLEECESKDLDELSETLKLEVSDEEQINKGARGCKVDDTVLSLSSDD